MEHEIREADIVDEVVSTFECPIVMRLDLMTTAGFRCEAMLADNAFHAGKKPSFFSLIAMITDCWMRKIPDGFLNNILFPMRECLIVINFYRRNV